MDMESLRTILLMAVWGATTVCWAGDNKSQSDDEEDDTFTFPVEVLYKDLPTRSLGVEVPEVSLSGRKLNVTFDEPLPYVDIRVLDAGSGAVVFASAYAYESEVELDLSGYPKGSYIIRMETGTAVYEGAFSL